MERLLYFLPKKPQPVWVRCATTTVVMAFCMAVQIGLESQTGFVGLFFLLPGIFVAGLMFDRGASLYATALGTAFAYFSISPTAPFPGHVGPCLLFAGTGAIVGLVAEGLRTEMEKVVRAEKAKTVLLMELAHRTKNNLAMLSAMMRLQAKHPDVTASDALGEMAARIHIMAQVYDHLTIRADRKVVDARHYLTEICQHLAATISGTSPVAIKAVADELYIHSEQAVPIAIIVNELVTNSLKYAFPEGRSGLIQVTLRADGEVVLSVTDNGLGIRGVRPEGIGSRILSLLTQQLGGTITSENLASLGVAWRVLIKSRLVIATPINVRIGLLCGLKSDISRGPRSAHVLKSRAGRSPLLAGRHGRNCIAGGAVPEMLRHQAPNHVDRRNAGRFAWHSRS